MDVDEFNALLARAILELEEKQKSLYQDYRIGEFARWHFQQETATLSFFDWKDQLRLVADYVSIGSFDSGSKTWKWAWCNSSLLPALRQASRKLRELSGITGMDLFAHEEPFAVDLDMSWELAAFAVMHLGALGCYRPPTSDGSLLMFFALKEIHAVN